MGRVAKWVTLTVEGLTRVNMTMWGQEREKNVLDMKHIGSDLFPQEVQNLNVPYHKEPSWTDNKGTEPDAGKGGRWTETSRTSSVLIYFLIHRATWINGSARALPEETQQRIFHSPAHRLRAIRLFRAPKTPHCCKRVGERRINCNFFKPNKQTESHVKILQATSSSKRNLLKRWRGKGERQRHWNALAWI